MILKPDFSIYRKHGRERAQATHAFVGLPDRRVLSLVENGEHIGWFGADPKVSVTFCKQDGVGLVDDEDGGERKTPTGFGGVVIAETGVVEGDVDKNGLIVAAELLRNGVGYAKSLCDRGAGVGEQRILQAVLLESESVLTGGLRGYGDEDGAALAEVGVQIAPGFEFGDAVRIPTATEEFDDERAEGEEVG